MDAPTTVSLVRWMASLTLREALASRLFWVTSFVSGACVLLCLSISVQGEPPLPLEQGERRLRLPLEEYQRIPGARAEGVDPASCEMTVLFGAFRVHYRHYPEDAVRFLQYLMAGLVADTAGVLLVLLWTAGFLPSFLRADNAAVLLGKPVPRWGLLLGKYLGVVAFVALQTLLFVVGTWLALALKTGVWAPQYLLCAPVLLLHFAVFFSVSVCLAVCFRRTVVCMVGVLAFWAVCWATNHSWHVFQATTPDAPVPVLLDAGYWTLPKPADLNWTLYDLLDARRHFGSFLTYPTLAGADASPLLLSALTSMVFAAVVLILAAVRFERMDY